MPVTCGRHWNNKKVWFLVFPKSIDITFKMQWSIVCWRIQWPSTVQQQWSAFVWSWCWGSANNQGTPALATCQPRCECPETIPLSPSIIHMSDEELGCPENYHSGIFAHLPKFRGSLQKHLKWHFLPWKLFITSLFTQRSNSSGKRNNMQIAKLAHLRKYQGNTPL